MGGILCGKALIQWISGTDLSATPGIHINHPEPGLHISFGGWMQVIEGMWGMIGYEGDWPHFA